MTTFSTIEDAIIALKEGRMIILVDNEDRENEGDLVLAADFATPESINFMINYGRGLVCLPMSEKLIDKLDLPMMTSKNRSPYGTAFTVSIEATTGVSTGISAADRARTIQAAINPDATSRDIISPGHIFPLRAHPGGVLKRNGQTEGSVDLAKIAGLTPAAVICEIINEDGSMSRRDDLVIFSKSHNIPMVSISDLISYRIKHEQLASPQAISRLPIHKHGEFTMTVFKNELDNCEHFSLVKDTVNNNMSPLVRVHSECITGDVFGSCKCDCGSQLEDSLELISAEGGILIYLRQEGRGIGLANKIKAYALQEQGFDTVEANLKLGLPIDNRDFAVAYQILKYFNIKSIRLITNNPSKVETISKYGIEVGERVSLTVKSTNENKAYLKTKREKMGHLLSVD